MPRSDSQTQFMVLYRDLYEHATFLEETLGRLLRREKVNRSQLEGHLSQMLAVISKSQKENRIATFTRKGKKKSPNPFHNDMVRVTRVVRNQVAVLLQTSFLIEKSNPGVEYIQTLSDIRDNIRLAFQQLLQENIFTPINLN